MSLLPRLCASALLLLPLTTLAGWQFARSDEFSGSNIELTHWTFDLGNGNGGWGNGEFEQVTNNALALNWATGIVQSAPALAGPWQDISNAVPPLVLPSVGAQQYCRLR